ncbi:DivIVA domain-containing protein [Aquirufa ecclesiirivi]|uniref:DivIVA domain-containing protein n=1 Tax=Aquirufa ecclesiirivi TaxID=2715124 RepID=UPI0022A84530|nr:DivIVA domain-containing protein [Aquirufa ecclesiirivi]MCZ2471920.1 DivIVA domain-containing protein [Aquirufa ecclesiirivi]
MEHIYELPEASFSKSFRGYDVSEVNDYLFRIEEYHQSIQQSRDRLESKIAELEKELNRLKEAESSMLMAVQMAEEAQLNWKVKAEKDAELALQKAQKQASQLIEQAEKEAAKIKLLAEGESKQILVESNQTIKEQERVLRGLQEAQKEVAEQLMGISEKTLQQIKTWSVSNETLTKPKEPQEKVMVEVKKPMTPKSKTVSKQANKAKKTTLKAKPKGKVGRPKSTISATADKKSPAKRGRKPKSAVISQAAKPVNARGTKNSPSSKKKGIDPTQLVPDDSLPTLNKVLEAYAKSSGPQGKIGEIN